MPRSILLRVALALFTLLVIAAPLAATAGTFTATAAPEAASVAAPPEIALAAVVDGPSPRFGYSVLDQAATSIQKTVLTVNNQPPSGNPPTVVVSVFQPTPTVEFVITIQNLQRTTTVREYLSPNLAFSSFGTCFPVTVFVRPAGVSPFAQAFDCTVSGPGPNGSGTATLGIRSQTSFNTALGVDNFANTACVPSSATDTSIVTTCSSAALNFVQTPPPTPFPSPTPLPTPQLQNRINSVDNAPPSPSNTNANVNRGDELEFRVNVSNVPIFFGPNAASVYFFLSPNLAGVVNDFAGATCSSIPTPPTRPAGVAFDATTFSCLVPITVSTGGAGTGSFSVLAQVEGDAPFGNDPQAGVACFATFSAFGTLTFTNCAPVQVVVVGASPTVGPLPTTVPASTAVVNNYTLVNVGNPPLPLLPSQLPPPPPPYLPRSPYYQAPLAGPPANGNPPPAPTAPPQALMPAVGAGLYGAAGQTLSASPPSGVAGVPVIPEADSLPLVGGGLAALGLLGWWRSRRRGR